MNFVYINFVHTKQFSKMRYINIFFYYNKKQLIANLQKFFENLNEVKNGAIESGIMMLQTKIFLLAKKF